MNTLEFLALVIGLSIWLLCGTLAYGLTIGYFQRHYYSVRSKDIYGLAIFTFAIGPIGLLLALPHSEWGYHGLKWTAQNSESTLRRRAEDAMNHNRYPELESDQSRERRV